MTYIVSSGALTLLTHSLTHSRVSYDSSVVNAEMITTGSDQAEELPTATESHTRPVSNTRQTSKKTKSLQHYDELKINSAVADMQSGMSARSAALKWGVPRTTLQNRRKAGFKSAARPGPATILTTDEETALCNWLIELSRRGMPVQKKHLLDSIQQIITTDGRQTPFVNNRPGKAWFRAYLRDTRI